MFKKMDIKYKSTSELIKIAYVTEYEDNYRNIIAEVNSRGTANEFEAARELTESIDPIKREIGADILGQLGWQNKSFQSESVSLLINLLSDPAEDVVASAAFALGHRNSPEAIQSLKRHLKHSNPRIRHGVAFGLSCLENESAIDGLITLSHDPDYDVRNWATFGLGSQCEIDNIELRNALKDRAEDTDPEIRGEALIGLAKRKDNFVIEKIEVELSGEFYGGWAIEAAELFPHQEFIPLLTALKDKLYPEDSVYFADDIESALLECRKKITIQLT